VIVLDTSVLYALIDAADAHHRRTADWYVRVDQELITTPLVLAEVDHLASTRGGHRAVLAFRADVRAGAYAVDWWPAAASEAAIYADRYLDLGIGLTDASLVVLADRVGTVEIATFDERHFRATRPITGGPAFRLLPIDAPNSSKRGRSRSARL
jgi:predicted nucleic acid-binding protein